MVGLITERPDGPKGETMTIRTTSHGLGTARTSPKPLAPSDRSIATAADRCTPYRFGDVSSPTGGQTRRLLGVWAHPDDEAYLSAGLMARTVAAGGDVTVVALSDGEAGFGSDDPRPVAERAQLRRNELQAAMRSIGVTDVRFAGLPDGELNRHSDQIVEITSHLLADLEPDVTVTFGPDGMTGHPDHVTNSWAVTRAWSEIGIGELWYAAKSPAWLDRWRTMHDDFGIWMDGEPRGVDATDAVFMIDAAGAELDAKRRVLAKHASQTTPLASALGEATYRDWISEEIFRRPSRSELHTVNGHPSMIGSVA